MNFKKILALVLVVAMCLTMVPTYAFADDVELWDEGDAAVQNDAPLEDEYIDEDPVTQEPAEEEPEATDPAEPAAAEEPAADETPVAEVLASEETNDFEAVAAIKNITQNKDYENNELNKAVAQAAAGDQLLINTLADNAYVSIGKSLTITGNTDAQFTASLDITEGTVTLQNFGVRTINVYGGTLSIPAGDTATFGTVTAHDVTSGDVKGGTFTEISAVLLADGYYANSGVAPVPGSYIPGLDPTLVVGGAVKEMKDYGFVAKIVINDNYTGYYSELSSAINAIILKQINITGVTVDYDSLVITPLVACDATISADYSTYADKAIKIAKVDGAAAQVSLNINTETTRPLYFITNTEAAGVVTYMIKRAVASYLKAGQPVYTTTFNEAATKAAELDTRAQKDYGVTLYACPASTDVYEMGIGKLTVVATPTDLWNENNANAAVKVTGEKVRNVEFNNGTAVYTVTGAIAKARLNTTEETYEYFDDIEDAIKFVAIEHNNPYMHLIPLENTTFTVNSTSLGALLGKTIKIDNSGDKKITLAEVEIQGHNYSYSVTPGENFNTYTLKPAVVRIPAKDQMDEYYDVVPGTEHKYFTSFADAVKTDSTAVIELIATPTDLTTQKPTTETYELGIPGGPSTLKVRLNEFKWLKVNPYGQAAVVEKPDTTDATVTVYSLAEPVASITTGTGASAETTYYDDFADAAYAAYMPTLADCATITLLKTIEEPYELTTGWCFKVIKGAYNVTVTAKDADKAVLAETDENGVTSYSVVDPVASIDFGGEVGVKNYATFAEAAKLAYVPADAEDTLTVTLLKKPGTDDKFEVSAPGMFYVDIASTGAVIVRDNLSFAEGTTLIATPALVEGTTYTVTIVGAVAYVDNNGVPTYFDSFKAAVDAGNYAKIDSAVAPPTIYMLASDETAMKLTEGYQVNVKLNGFTVDVDPYNEGPYMILDETDETTGVTNYQCVTAVASIGADDDLVYYSDFATAATAAAETETITLYQSASYVLGAEGNVKKLIVNKNGNTLTVESGVTGQAVKETQSTVGVGTGTKVISTYELVKPVASVTVIDGDKEVTTYYDTFANAVNAAAAGANTIVLLDNIADPYELLAGKDINVKLGTFTVTVEAIADSLGYPAAILKTFDEETEVTTFKSVYAVASVDFGTEETEDVKYYATVGGEDGAITAAFAPEGTDPVYTVVLLEHGTIAADDKFVAESSGSFLVDITDNPSAAIAENHVTAIKGDYVGVDPVDGKANNYLVTLHGAVASVIKNDGTPKYYGTVKEAVVDSNAQHPVILLADGLSYALPYTGEADKDTIYVDKNGFEFTVTKAEPANPLIAVAIEVEELDDGITRYTAVGDASKVIAYVDFVSVEPDGDFGSKPVHNYVYYTSFADAVEDANKGEFVIYLTRDMVNQAATASTPAVDETYVITDTDELIRLVPGTFTALIVADEGLKLSVEDYDGEPAGYVAHKVYSVSLGVASVTAVFSGTEETTEVYDNFADAVADAIAHYGDVGHRAVLTLYADPGEEVFTFNSRDALLVAKNDFSFTTANFSAPEGRFVKYSDATYLGQNVVKYEIGTAVASVTSVDAEGKTVVDIYETFNEAVEKVLEIENDKAYNDPTKDPANPDTVINLWADNPVAFTFKAPGTGVQSLMIADNGFNPNLLPAADTDSKKYFVEEIGTDALGVTQYKNSQIIASVDYSPVWAAPGSEDENIVNYSSFAAAANDAMRDGKVVKIIAVYADFANDDVFEMRIGALQVDRNYMITPDQLAGFIADKRIVPVGENVALSCTWDDPDVKKAKVATFVVEGNEAMIVYPGEATPRFFKTFLEAMKVQNGNVNLPITPLTDIEYIYTEAELGALRTFILAENVNYPVSVKLDKYETVADKTVTHKFDFKPGVCYIVSDVPVGYDATYATIYRNDYYATITSAVDDAQNTKTIVLMQNNSYEIQDADEVVIAQIGDANHQDVNSFIVTTNIEGSGVSYTHTDPVSGVHKGVYTYTVVATQSIVVNPGEGGSFSDGSTDPKTLAIDVPDATIPATAYATANLPVRTGYTVDYYDGNDGKKYAATADTVKGIFAFPDKMPENGLELTPHWTAQDVNVFFYDNGNQIKALATTVKYGELIPEPTYTVTGYHVVGWYRDAAFEHSFIFAATPVTSDLMDKKGNVKLYAKMAKDEFTVHFTSLADNVPDDSVNDLTVEYGATIAGPKVTDWTRAGYKDGKVTAWMYTAPGATEPTAWVWSNGVTSNLTLVADWEPETVTIVWADGSEVIHTDKKVNVDSELTSPDVSKRTKPNARIDTVNTWVDQDGVYYNGKVPYHTVDPWIFQINWIDQVDVSFIYNDELIKTISVDMNSTLADNEDVPKPEDETKAYAWTLKGEDYDVTTPVTATLTLVGTLVEVEPEPDYSGYATVASSLSLEDNINMNAYVTIKEGTDPADYGVTVTFNGETTVDGTLADLATYYRGEYKLSDIAIVAAPQMNDPADVTITYKGVEATTATLTVRGYAEEHIEDERFEEVKDLLVALLDFGAYSQLQFNYDTDNLANAKYSSGMVPTTDIPEFQMTTAGKVTGITGASPALTLVSDTTLNMYFAAPKKGDFQFKVDGETAKATYARKEYKASLPKIAVAELGDEHDFTVTSGNETMTVTLAPLAYAFQHQNDEGTLGNVCKAVYLYYLAAVEYFG